MNIEEERKNQKVKCVVWDLDNTIWDGILSEDIEVKIKENVLEVIKELDRRGILQSISSKNHFDIAMKKLEEFKIEKYFIYPQINWSPKSEAIESITKSINIGIDTIAFIDDQDFELEEVKYNHAEVLCINASDIDNVLDLEPMNPKFVTEDSKLRRIMYMNDIERNKVEEKFGSTKEDFLASLNMILNISEAKEEDLMRVEELTVRTHQLNASGYTYSYDELRNFVHSEKHKLLVIGLDDKFGTYGKIGLVLLEQEKKYWNINLFIMSCRVISRGVGNIVLNYIMNFAKENNMNLRAKFIPTDRNRMMYITYKFSGFTEIEKLDEVIIFENKLDNIRKCPDYVQIID